MNVLLLASLMNFQPLPVIPPQTLESLFRTQQVAVMQDIRIDIQADLEQRAARFFTAEGGLQQQLRAISVMETGFAAR